MITLINDCKSYAEDINKIIIKSEIKDEFCEKLKEKYSKANLKII